MANKRWTTAVVAIFGIAVASCGTNGTTQEEAELTEAQLDACQALIDLGMWEPPEEDEPAEADLVHFRSFFERIQAGAEEESPEVADAAASTIAVVNEVIETSNYELLDGPEIGAGMGQVGLLGRDVCGYDEIDLGAEDTPEDGEAPARYEFTGVPDTLEPGRYSIQLENDQENFHLVIVAKVPGDYEGTVDDFAQLEEEAAIETVEWYAAGAFAEPDETAYLTVDLSEPGRYFILCPVTSEDEEIPHHALGMIEEVTVG
ncbi:hypothetical protein ONR57_05855 [Hoyosella sp. YIM 151337]|uniref:hypothetical protein n=1 Tax=Hoyosella sp. YIM 151337 TaxID=2992742 RepID=UPI002236427D|nr:hypothetical protein [Hoyosella sp. YIM 151337]MCW4352821.1 hypothetical protein [Hoyosella sp. YIM 151337]